MSTTSLSHIVTRSLTHFVKPNVRYTKMNNYVRNISTSRKFFNCTPPIVSGSKDRTMKELTIELAKSMGVEIDGFKSVVDKREHLIQYLPTSQSELPKRSMEDSFLVGIIALSTDRALQDKYTTFLGNVRYGRLLEDMDIFAVMVAQKHILNPKLPPGTPFPVTLVTAFVDKIDFTHFSPKPQQDIRISGHVSWVGTSSMEVVVWLEQNVQSKWERITRALFLIAARDPTNLKSAIVNALAPANERETQILSGGETRKQQRFAKMKRHVTKTIPDQQEQSIIHDLYLKSLDEKQSSLTKRILPSGFVWMNTCTLSNVIFSQPDNRNLHNTVFGGFIMRQAEELSWALCYIFSKYRPVLRSISDINFQRPIAVNSLIRMHAHVVYTEMQFVQISVYVETYNPVTGKSDTTNTFHFTFEVPEVVHQVMPHTYHEAMMYIDGRRHFNEIMNINVRAEAGILDFSSKL